MVDAHKNDPVERFEALVAQYGHVIRSAIRSVAGRQIGRLGEDAEQQVLLELWKQISNEQEIAFPSSYLYKAAVRETIRLARQLRGRAEGELEPARIVDSDPVVDPERRAVTGEIGARLEEVTRGLIDPRRKAVTAHLAGYTVREIMETNGWSYNRARNLIARGMADLRRALKEKTE